MNTIQRKISDIIEDIASEEGIHRQNALVDLLNDIWHVATAKGLDIEMAFDDAETLYEKQIVRAMRISGAIQ